MRDLLRNERVILTLKIGLFSLPLFIFWWFNRHNIPVKFSLLLGLIALPFVANSNAKSIRTPLIVISIILATLLVLTRSGTLFFFLAIIIAFITFDRNFGKLNLLPFLLAFIISPAFSNVVYIWSFPIRIKLTSIAAATLKLAKMTISVSGNVIFLNGESYSVDPACVGLNMIVTTLVVALIAMGFAERKYKLSTPLWTSLLLLSSVVMMSVFSNFIRLLVLIIFHILPENPLHDVVGVMCMLIYVIGPFMIISKWVYSKIQVKQSVLTNQEFSNTKLPISANSLRITALLVIIQIAVGWQFLTPQLPDQSTLSRIKLDGYTKEVTQNGVLKLQNTTSLIYIKPPVQFYQGSHDPRYCWQGSGYEFSEMQQEKLGNNIVYTATLTKDNDKIYTAWWYQNNSTITPNEWDWRWKSILHKGDYFMININCQTREELKKTVFKGISIAN